MGAMMPMVPPGGAGGEADGAADNEDRGRQVDLQLAGTGHGVGNEIGGVHAETGQAAQGPREGQDRDRRDRLDKALRHALEGLLKADGAPQPEVHKGEHQRDRGADGPSWPEDASEKAFMKAW